MEHLVSLAAVSKPQRFNYLSQKRSDLTRSKTRVSLGDAYSRWTQMENFHGIKTGKNFHGEGYESTDYDPSTSTPRKILRLCKAGSPSTLIGVSVFGAFLRSEFSEENLQFYLACEQYRHSSNNFSLQRRAKHICATYIQSGAPREVNLDSKTRDLTLQLLQAPSRTSLLPAQKRVYSLLDTDCYPRFLQSEIYLSLLKEAE